MQNKYRIVLASVITITSLLILILSVLTNKSTEVKNISVLGGLENAETTNQIIKIEFSNPIKKVEDLNSKIIFTPEVKFLSHQTGRNIFIFPKENLNYNNNYTISTTSFEDIFNRSVKDFQLNFKTKGLKFYYIEKQEGGQDKLVKTDAQNTNKETIYESKEILKYSFNKNYVALVEKNNTDQFTLVIIGKDKTTKEVFNNKQFSDIAVSPIENLILLGIQEYDYKDKFFNPLSGYQLHSYNIETNTLEKYNLDESMEDVAELRYSPSGDSIIYKGSTGEYFLFELKDKKANIPLGSFISFGDFNQKGDELLFTTFDPMQTYTTFPYIVKLNYKREQYDVTDKSGEDIDPKFINNNGIIFSRTYNNSVERGLYKIMIKNIQTGELKSILEIADYSLELASPSPDGTYLIAEKYHKDDLENYNYQRSYGYNTKPNKANLLIYDIENNKIINDKIVGIDAKWIQ